MILKPVAKIIPKNMTRLYYLTFTAGLYRPVALTYLVMKPIEKAAKSLIVLIIQSQLNPLQVAYRARRGV